MTSETLSDLELTSALDACALKGRENTVQLLRHLIEFGSRKLYRELGYPSLFEYCVRRLKLSEGGACRRVSAARCLRENPELAQMLLDGEISLCAVATAAKSIEKRVTSLTEIAGCSTRKVREIVSVANPVTEKPREVIKPVVIEGPADLVEPPKREERVVLEFSVSKETFEAFKGVQAELSVESGRTLSVEEVFGRLLKGSRRVKRRVPVKPSTTRYIPREIRREVYSRDEGQCTFVSTSGLRCCERRHLEFDHREPFATGGRTETGNLRLLCPAHNRLMAERAFGREFIQRKISAASAGGESSP